MTSSADSLKVKLGQRIIEPAFPVVDDRPPSNLDLSHDLSLRTYMEFACPAETVENLRRKELVLATLSDVFQSWVTEVCLSKGYPLEVAASAGAVLKTSGSYRLGINDKGADIDMICVTPSMVERADFFDTLGAKLEAMRSLTDLVKIPTAQVPIMNFRLDGVEIDLQFARLNMQSIPHDFDIEEDNVLLNVDLATEKSLNGPRVTSLISRLVCGTPERMKAFMFVVRFVRKWAKARGLYSNKLGYLGGVNYNIMVAMILQLYPNSSPSALLHRFFFVFKSWRWPNPVLLCAPYNAHQEDMLGGEKTVWSGQLQDRFGRVQRQIMPIVTPAYPAMNSSANVSKQTLQIIQAEIVRAHGIVERLWKDPSFTSSENKDGHMWSELFEFSDFFIDYPHYLAVVVVGPNAKDFENWKNFVESRLRFLVSENLGASLPLSKIQLWPYSLDGQKHGKCYADESSMLTEKQRLNSATWFIGFQIGMFRMRRDEVEKQIQYFKTSKLSNYSAFVPGLDLVTKYFSVKELPPSVFEVAFDEDYGPIYKGGKDEAMAKRKAKRDAAKAAAAPPPPPLAAEDTASQPADAAKAAAEEKTEEEEEEVEDGGKAADEGGEGRPVGLDVMDEENGMLPLAVTSSGAEDEATLLERALDGMNQGEMKTREEAERERQMLLEGDFLGEDDADNDEVNAEILARAGFKVDEGEREVELKIEVPVWRLPPHKRTAVAMSAAVGGGWGGGPALARVKLEEENATSEERPKVVFVFKTPFTSVVELDADGAVVDTGDDNYKPCKSFAGRMGGFEFKMGERGLGYYKTGVKVVLPANVLV